VVEVNQEMAELKLQEVEVGACLVQVDLQEVGAEVEGAALHQAYHQEEEVEEEAHQNQIQ